jgi:glyoxylase-like metal-dependent hydrolase (beta-lactamase superfamily II)
MTCARTPWTESASPLLSRRDQGCVVTELSIVPGGSASVFVLPDHTVNAALFPAARIHDHWAMYVGDRWVDRDADGLELSPSVRLLRTPGHTAEDISTVAPTPEDVYVCTHAWWMAAGPADDPLGASAADLHASREKLLSFATVIIPGHGWAAAQGGSWRTNPHLRGSGAHEAPWVRGSGAPQPPGGI